MDLSETSKEKIASYIHQAVNDKADADFHAGTVMGQHIARMRSGKEHPHFQGNDNTQHPAAADRFHSASANQAISRSERRSAGIKTALHLLTRPKPKKNVDESLNLPTKRISASKYLKRYGKRYTLAKEDASLEERKARSVTRQDKTLTNKPARLPDVAGNVDVYENVQIFDFPQIAKEFNSANAKPKLPPVRRIVKQETENFKNKYKRSCAQQSPADTTSCTERSLSTEAHTLYELEQTTLHSYVKKAQASIRKDMLRRINADDQYGRKLMKRIVRRDKGLDTAAQKLTEK